MASGSQLLSISAGQHLCVDCAVKTLAADVKALALNSLELVAVFHGVQAQLGEVLMLFSEAEFDVLLEAHASQLIVLEAGLSWCRPCKGFERTFQVLKSVDGFELDMHFFHIPAVHHLTGEACYVPQKFAEFYDQAIFLRFYGDSNETCRHMFANRVRAASTPNFSFFRDGASAPSSYPCTR